MIATLILVIILLVVRLVFLEFRRSDLEYEASQHRILVLEWYNYLSEKKYGDDFKLWKQELDE